MEVTNKGMYHYHHPHLYPEVWVPNNEIIIDDNFETSFLNILKYYSTAVNTVSGKKTQFDNIISGYLEEDQDKETYIKLLKDARRIIAGANIFKRELALEQARIQYHPELPSRKHSIWLCEEKGLDFWKTELVKDANEEIDLYKVLVTGNMFKSSDSFIPSNNIIFEKQLERAKEYWEPKFETEEQEIKAEYLFQGKVKILERIK